MIYLQLFWEFFKTGLFAIGGGLATLPFLSKMSERFGWFTQEDIGNMLAVSESTPGPIGVNMATYVGSTVCASQAGLLGGFLGGLLTTTALILPSYLVILIVSKILFKFQNNRYVLGAMDTLRPASVGMVTAAVFGIIKTVLFDFEATHEGLLHLFVFPNIILFLLLFLLYRKFQKIHPVVLLAIGAAAGILFQL